MHLDSLLLTKTSPKFQFLLSKYFQIANWWFCDGTYKIPALVIYQIERSSSFCTGFYLNSAYIYSATSLSLPFCNSWRIASKLIVHQFVLKPGYIWGLCVDILDPEINVLWSSMRLNVRKVYSNNGWKEWMLFMLIKYVNVCTYWSLESSL